jgi:hypothetical protein
LLRFLQGAGVLEKSEYEWLAVGGFIVLVPGAETSAFAPFYPKNDHFTKTGSGQT